MVKFLCALSNNPDVEDAMREINNYVLFNDDSAVNDSLILNNIESEFQNYVNKIESLNLNYTINPYREMVSQGKMKKIKLFIKKVIRKFVSWYIKDICVQQVDINANFVRVINQQMLLTQMLMEENKHLKKKIEKLNSKTN